MPKWCTPERRVRLVELFLQSQGFCIFGHRPCPYPDHHYENFIEGLIWEWKRDDTEERAFLWRLEQRRIHRLPEFRQRGPFDVVARDEFLLHQPDFYLEGLAINPFTNKRLAMVRIASSNVRLFVDVGDSIKGMSKTKRRKVWRHGDSPPAAIMVKIEYKCRLAVQHYWSKSS